MSTTSYDYDEPQQQPQQPQQHLFPKKLSKPEEIDLYAQQLIEYTARTLQPPPTDHHHHIDDSLGSYITNCLRTATLESDIMMHPPNVDAVDDDDEVTRIHQSLILDDITMIPDYESFCELIQEHCQMVIPDNDDHSSTTTTTTTTTHPMAVQVLQKIWRAVVTRHIPPEDWRLLHPPKTVNSIHPEKDHRRRHHPELLSSSLPEWEQVEVNPDRSSSGGRMTTTTTTNHDTTTTTTTLIETPSLMMSPPPQTDEQQVVVDVPPPYDHDEASHYLHHHHHHHEDVDDYIRSNIVNQLLQWYVAHDVSYDAAYQATCLAQNNMILAQYIIASALTQIPICKHLMNDGKCYRADCTFNHSMEHHTCVFWMKSRGCSKQDGAIDPCRFLHGFSSKLLENIPEPIQLQAAAANHSHDNNNGRSSSSSGSGMITPYQNIRDFYATSTHNANTTTASANSGNSQYNDYYSYNTNSTNNNAKSFANIASQGYHTQKSFSQSDSLSAAATTKSNNGTTAKEMQQMLQHLPTTLIPQNLWQAHENRDASAFYISDPIERYHAVSATTSKRHDSYNKNDNNVIDLHYQSIKTFPVVLDVILPEKLSQLPPPSDPTSMTTHSANGIWIVTGTGHHVNTQRTHQKGGSTLEHAVLEYLISNYLLPHQTSNTAMMNGPYRIYRGRDRNGKGGAILIQKK